MDLNRVRFAGYLSKVEYKQTTNYWCVIRDGGFFVYNYHNVTSAPIGHSLEDTPVQQFPISHLSATAYVLPNGNKRVPTPFALQLDCADTGVATTFFAEHEWALEQWVDAIKAEASADHVFPSEECDLLPPSGYHGLRRESLEVAAAGAFAGRRSPSNYEHEVIVEQAESVFDRLVKDVVAPSKEYGLAAAKAARSPLLSEKNLKKTFMLRALPDVIPLAQQRQQFKDQCPKSPLGSRRRHLTPSPASSCAASSSRIGSSFQGSADESSLGSVAQFSPSATRRRNNPRALPERETLRPGPRQPAPAPALGRSPSKPRSPSKDQTWSRNEAQGGNGSVARGSKSKPTVFVLAQEAAGKGAFGDAAEAIHANRTGLDAGQHSRKRHTITVVQQSTGRNDGKSKDVRERTNPEQSPKTRARHSIAPLSSLDLNIAQRRRATRQLPEARLFYNKTHGHLTSYESSTSSSSSSSSSEDEDEANKDNAADYNRPSVEIAASPSTSLASGWSTTTSTSFDSSFNEGDLSASFSSTSEDMRSAVYKLKGRLQVPSPDHHQQAEGPSSTSSIDAPHPANEPLRKASESFGNRFLHRAKSMIGKQHKSEERTSSKSLATSPNARANSLSEDCLDLTQYRTVDKVEITRINDPKENCQEERIASLGPIHLEGALFRRKRLKWSRTWAVLHTSKMMAFYKDANHRDREVPLFLIDLKLGCDIGHVTQDKAGSSFTLTSNSNPKEGGKMGSSLEQNDKGAESRTRRSVQLLCKSVPEFVYWIKAFVLVNTSAQLPTKVSSSPTPLNESLISKQGQTGINFESSSRFDVPGIASSSAAGAGSTYAPGVDVLEDFPTLRCAVTPPALSGLDPSTLDTSITVQTPLFKLDRNANHPRDDHINIIVGDSVFDSSTALTDLRTDIHGKTLEPADGVKRYFRAETSREKVIARDLLADVSGSDDNGRREQTGSSSNIRGASQPGSRSTREEQCQVRGIKASNLQVGMSGACQVDAGEVRSDRAANRRCNNDAQSPGPRALIAGESDCGAAQTEATRGRSSADERELPPALPFSSRALVHKDPECRDSITTAQTAVPSAAAALELPRIINRQAVINRSLLVNAPVESLWNINPSLEQPIYPEVFEFAATDSLPYSNNDQLICKPKSSFRRRRQSDGNILEACCDKPYRMRFSRRPVPELTKIDFIEIYGGYNGNKDACTDSEVHTHLNINMKFLAQKRRSVHKESENRSMSSEESSSSGVSSSGIGSTDQHKTNLERSHSHLSSASASSDGSTKVGSRSGRFSHIAAALRFGSRGGDQTGASSAGKATVLHLPASQMANAAHRGYMDRRGKKKQWERFWCVLQDSCLYCYNSPQSASTRDVILLRGYDVIADVINVNRSRFMFRLAQEGAPTLHFSADNHQDYLLWVGTLERDTRSVNNPGSGASPDGNRKDTTTSSKYTNSLSPAHSVSGGSLRSSDSTEDASRSNLGSSLNHSESSERLGQDLVEMEKHKLLKEIVNQQHQILHEQKQLAKKISCDSPSSSPTASAASPLVSRRSGNNSIIASPPPPAIRREVVLNRFERVRDAEDLKMTKFMTHLTRRRNSAQLKVDQLSREIAPRTGKRRSADHRRFAAVEARLGEMRARLAGIDEEIAVGQAKQQNVISKLRERQDFELLLAEQQETLAIMRRHEHDVSTGLVVPPARRFHRASSASAVVTGRREPLASIEDLSSISDCSSSGSLELSSESKGVIRTMSTPRQQRSEQGVRQSVVIPLSSDSIDSATEEYNQRVIRPSGLCSRSSSSIEDPIASSSMSCSASSLPAAPSQSSDVDPAVMAEIEMFEQFSALTLQKIQSRSPQNSL